MKYIKKYKKKTTYLWSLTNSFMTTIYHPIQLEFV